jgi:hypothetical protein
VSLGTVQGVELTLRHNQAGKPSCLSRPKQTGPFLPSLIPGLGEAPNPGWTVGSGGLSGKSPPGQMISVVGRSGPGLLPVAQGFDKSVWSPECGVLAGSFFHSPPNRVSLGQIGGPVPGHLRPWEVCNWEVSGGWKG